jgi:predicted amidohydrolase YtcJ
MDSEKPVIEALVIRNGLIAYCGDHHEARQFLPPQAEKIDLRGRIALPGFIESHSHPFHVGQWSGQWWVNCEEMHTIDEIIENLRNKATQTPPGQWVLGFRYDNNRLAEKRHPTRFDLDRASQEHPIFLFHFSQHSAVLNSKALQLGSITSSTVTPQGGGIDRDDRGEPIGRIEEKALSLIKSYLPTYSVEEIRLQLMEAAKLYHAAGVTSVFEAWLGKLAGLSEAAALAEIAETGSLPLRISAAIPYQLWKALKAGNSPGLEWGHNPERVHPVAVKFFQDGSLFTGTAMSIPSRGQSNDYHTYLTYSQFELEKMTLDVHASGWQICVHANGNMAIQSTLDAIERALTVSPRPDHRHRIEHCQLPTDEQLDRIASLGILPTFFPAHIWHWGHKHIKNLGAERAARLSPMASALKRGLIVGMHNDSPFTPIEPLLSIGVSVTRKSKHGAVLGREEAVTVEHALRAFTMGNAYLIFEEDMKGSLTEGKLGDVTILERNPYKVPAEEIKNIEVAMTISGGDVVYTKNGG